jgi:hypothetical protein
LHPLIFLFLLAVAWALVVLPAMLRSKQATPLAAAERFKRRMEMIAPARSNAGRWVIVPKSHGPRSRGHRRVLAQRRRFFQVLLGAAAAVLLIAFWRGGGWWEAQLLTDGAVAFYIAFLLAAKRQREDTMRKVRPLVARRAMTDAKEVTFYEPARASGGKR